MKLHNYVYPDKTYSRHLLYSSLITLIPGLYALFRKYYDFGIIHIAIVLTSINYWRDPKISSWRRYVDILVVNGGICYTIFRSIKCTNQILFLTFLSVGIVLYALSKYFNNIKNYDLSVDCHMGLHIIINMGYMILYNAYLTQII